MPSPIGHTLAGLVVHVATAPDVRDRRWAMVMVACANAADVDFAFRLIDGRNHHQQWTHSVGCAALAGLVTAAVTRRPRLALAAALAWSTHVLLDWLGRDTAPPIGLQALWPFSHEYWKSPLLIFLDVGRQPTWSTVVHNAQAAALETVILLPVLALALALRRRQA